mmetsp:Transcript_7864/g.11374  ORF Transcript_7864/g.11374 Transcript_7864/m.11374 type:complete len:456 (+) Transcript_7864:272-1639(+)
MGIDPQLKEIQTLRPSSVTPDLNEKKEEQVKTKLTLEDFAFTPLKKSRKLVPCQSQQQHTRQTVRHGGREQGKSHSKSGTQNPYLKRNPYLSSQKNQTTKAVSQPRLVLPVGNQTSTSDDENSDSDGSSVADEVVWKVFAGTKTILANSRKRRIELEERRQRLKRIQTERAEGTKSNRKKEEVVGLKKEDFGSMEVVGQFNMGFILAKCRNNHLWVLDQHACDEKYNFERLCKTTEIREQKLLHPMQLDLSPSEEACVLDHMNVFEKNGFRFQYDPDKAPRQRLSLTGLPHSGARDGCKAVQFGKDDVSALCALLGVTDGSSFSQDGGTGADGSGLYGNNAVRRYAGNSSQLTQQQDDNLMAMLPKTIAMFANRACRGSIMVGKALSQKEMESIVEKLKEVNHPWNCPHGRPTTRHVSDVLDDLICDTKRSLRCLTEPTVSIMPTTQLTQVEEES